MSFAPRVAMPDGYLGAPGGPFIAAIGAHLSPRTAAARASFVSALNAGRIDAATKEMLRIHNAGVSDCEFCKNVRYTVDGARVLDEGAVDAVTSRDRAGFPPREQAALELAEAFFGEPPAATTGTRERLRAHYSDAEIVELLLTLVRSRSGSTALIALGLEPEEMPTTLV